jgi:outer membrane protein OmpA-like peptidoglycan-associated protein
MSSRLNTISLALFVAGVVLAIGPTASRAQTATFLSNDATECEIFRGLSKLVPGECAAEGDIPVYGQTESTLTRSIKRRGGEKKISTPVEQRNPPEELSIALMVHFEFDSYVLTREVRNILDRVAKVINDDLMARSYIRVEGHADASGPETYNLTLSERRAHAVRKYLIEQHGVDSTKVLSIGRGESELYDPKDPSAGINRRVEFTNLRG